MRMPENRDEWMKAALIGAAALIAVLVGFNSYWASTAETRRANEAMKEVDAALEDLREAQERAAERQSP